MENNTKLIISYWDLKEMLLRFQMDGFNADGTICSLHLDEAEEIRDAIKDGYIQVKEN